MSSYRYQQTPSRRTDHIIGRTDFLNTIYDAIQNEGHTWLLYFHGPGGIGKTRLLEEIVTKNGKWDTLTFRCTPILDMYHSDYQSSDGVRHNIVTGLEKEGADEFREYHTKRNELEAKTSAGLSGNQLQQLQNEMEDAFLNNYRALAQDHRLVICLDTMELMQHESDPVQKICRVETVDALVMNWLVEQLPALPNTVILMAGRPENSERIKAIFTEQFYAVDNSFEAQELKAFSDVETGEYLKEIAQKLQEQGDPNLAESLEEYKDLGANFYQVTKGRPVYLALTIDLFLTQPRGGLPLINAILSGQEFPEDELVKQLIENLMGLPEPHGRIIQYLFYARKGLTVDLLQHFGVENIADHLKWLENLAIVKVRTVDKAGGQHQTYFFHDEVYNMYDQYFKGKSREGKDYYQSFVEYYRLKPQIDSLFYEMRFDPYQGYHFYYARQDHDAIRGHDHSYDMRLRNEVLGFLDRYVNKEKPFYDELIANRLNRNGVDRDCAVRWVRRHWAMGNSETARRVALDLMTSEDPLFSWNEIDDVFYKADLLVALVEAAVQEAADLKIAIDVLNRDTTLDIKEVPDLLNYAIQILQEKAKEDLNEAEQWHYHRISGAAHNRLGYFYRTTGRYGLALSHYQQAVAHLDLADVKSELAFTLTNAAYLLGLNSRTTEAYRLISRAIELHQELKRHYPLALALNTKGIIRALDNHPNWGVQDCRDALETVEKIGDDRGIGMALIGLGYTLRKQANQWKFGGIKSEMADSSFQEAYDVLNKAADTFSRFTEPIRLWEAYNELGSLYCDWAWLVRSQKNMQQAEKHYDKAITYQKRAEKIAKENKLEAQTLDTLDDLAQAYGDRSTFYIEKANTEAYHRDRRQAEAYLDEVETLIDARFKLTSGGFSPESGEGEAQWMAMGKRHLWRGVWRFRDVEYGQVARGDIENRLSDAMANLFLSTIYFRQYWPTSFDYDRTMGYLTRYLPQIRKYMTSNPQPLIWTKAQVAKLEEEYSIQLPELRNLIDRTVLF